MAKTRAARTKVQKSVKRRKCPTCGGDGTIADHRRDPGSIDAKELARAAGVGSVSRIFTPNPKSKRDTTFRRAWKIADHLGVTLDELREILEKQ